MGEQLINLETAKLAKEKGFNIKTKHWYDQTDCLNPVRGARGSMVYENVGYAPTQSLLAKWLRDVHGIDVFVIPNTSLDKEKIYVCYIKIKSTYHQFKKGEGLGDGFVWQEIGNNYEKAFEIGLVQGLKLI